MFVKEAKTLFINHLINSDPPSMKIRDHLHAWSKMGCFFPLSVYKRFKTDKSVLRFTFVP
jgi:hypothetical protein